MGQDCCCLYYGSRDCRLLHDYALVLEPSSTLMAQILRLMPPCQQRLTRWTERKYACIPYLRILAWILSFLLHYVLPCCYSL